MTQNSPRLDRLLVPSHILCHLAAKNRNDAFCELLNTFERSALPSADNPGMLQAIVDREAVFPTVIAPGLAVPHARLPELTEPLLAIGISAGGIDFELPSMPPVHVILLILTPGDDPGIHLQLLAALASAFKDPDEVECFAKLATPQEVIEHLSGSKVEVPKFLVARDLMERKVVTLDEGATLLEAIHVFATSGVSEIAVIDHEGDLRGLISTGDLLKLSMPEHLLWLEDLSPIYRFQPFSDLLKTAGETLLADVMREDFPKVHENVPAIQLAKLFLTKKLNQIIVVDSQNRLAGVVRQDAFAAKLFWE